MGRDVLVLQPRRSVKRIFATNGQGGGQGKNPKTKMACRPAWWLEVGSGVAVDALNEIRPRIAEERRCAPCEVRGISFPSLSQSFQSSLKTGG